MSHTKWNSSCHIIFVSKYRRKAIYEKLKKYFGRYVKRLCEYKDVEIVGANSCSDQVHMLVKIPPKLSVLSFMRYLKENAV